MGETQGETMSPRKKASGQSLLRVPRKKSSTRGFYTPFQDLKQRLMEPEGLNVSKRPAEPVVPAMVVESFRAEDDSALFREAVTDVVALDQSHRRVPLAKAPGRPISAISDDDEVRAHLCELISGSAEFQVSCSDEYIDGSIIGLSPRILARLRRGEYSCQAYVDLHGYNRVQARRAVIDFLRTCFARGQRCVLIVSGRGRNSENREPVLKDELVNWLTRSPLNRMVLAFSTARSHDGGAGAFYVLLRRTPTKAPLVSPTGW
jgi:DNA-nicking Smr family endonuclease